MLRSVCLVALWHTACALKDLVVEGDLTLGNDAPMSVKTEIPVPDQDRKQGEMEKTNVWKEMFESWEKLRENLEYAGDREAMKKHPAYVNKSLVPGFDGQTVVEAAESKYNAYMKIPDNQAFSTALNLEDAVAIFLYTVWDYRDMNNNLRGLCEKEPKAAQERCKNVEPINTVAIGALSLPNKLRRYGGKKLYRGSKSLPRVLQPTGKHQGYQEENFCFQDRGFMSTTSDKKIAEEGNFAGGAANTGSVKEINWVLEIDCSGPDICEATPIDMLSAKPQEKEVLFTPSAPFIVERFTEFDENGKPIKDEKGKPIKDNNGKDKVAAGGRIFVRPVTNWARCGAEVEEPVKQVEGPPQPR